MEYIISGETYSGLGGQGIPGLLWDQRVTTAYYTPVLGRLIHSAP